MQKPPDFTSKRPLDNFAAFMKNKIAPSSFQDLNQAGKEKLVSPIISRALKPQSLNCKAPDPHVR